MPIDPNGCSVDVSHKCWRKTLRPWAGDPTRVRVRYFRGAPGAPALEFPHSFGIPDRWDDQPPADLPAGVAGTTTGDEVYDNGAKPPYYAPNGTFVGTKDQWLNGSVRGRDPVLHATVLGYSLECLKQIPVSLRLHRWGQQCDGQQGAC